MVVLDDTDSTFGKEKPHDDGLRTIAANGDELWAKTGFGFGGSVGGVHGVVVDAKRDRIYVCENAVNRLTVLNRLGQKLWQIQPIEADAATLDEQTGNLWCSGGSRLNDGETVVFDPQGTRLPRFLIAPSTWRTTRTVMRSGWSDTRS